MPDPQETQQETTSTNTSQADTISGNTGNEAGSGGGTGSGGPDKVSSGRLIMKDPDHASTGIYENCSGSSEQDDTGDADTKVETKPSLPAKGGDSVAMEELVLMHEGLEVESMAHNDDAFNFEMPGLADQIALMNAAQQKNDTSTDSEKTGTVEDEAGSVSSAGKVGMWHEFNTLEIVPARKQLSAEDQQDPNLSAELGDTPPFTDMGSSELQFDVLI